MKTYKIEIQNISEPSKTFEIGTTKHFTINAEHSGDAMREAIAQAFGSKYGLNLESRNSDGSEYSRLTWPAYKGGTNIGGKVYIYVTEDHA